MRVFITGATGFIGSQIIRELLAAGHQVVGLTRSAQGAEALTQQGVEPWMGTLEQPASLQPAAAAADAVIHTAFDHNFANFADNCEKERRVLLALGEALHDGARPLIITSGTAMGDAGDGQPAREAVFNPHHPNPRVISEVTGQRLLDAGVDVRVMRLPQVHNPRRQGLISYYIDQARSLGVAGWPGAGDNSWSAGHVNDVARLYRLALEQGKSGERYHAVAEEAVSMREIAQVVGAGLNIPTVSIAAENIAGHFGWLAMFVGANLRATSGWTRKRLGWTPNGPGLLASLASHDYGRA